MDYFDISLPDREINKIPMLALAHIGDGVFELMVRSKLILEGKTRINDLHRACVKIVAATSQAKRMEKLLPHLTEEELAVFRRGRNAKVNSVPHAASVREYHEATGLEALFGALYLRGEKARLNELFSIAMEEPNENNEPASLEADL